MGTPPRFLCDAMLGGLARWLRAAGYDASFEAGVDDGVLVRRAAADQRVVLSSDGAIFDRTVVKTGAVRAFFVPRSTPPVEQLHVVLDAFDLAPRGSRCMACNGALLEIDKQSVAGEAPPRAHASHDSFWRCVSCRKLFWRGTHWTRIARALSVPRPAT